MHNARLFTWKKDRSKEWSIGDPDLKPVLELIHEKGDGKRKLVITTTDDGRKKPMAWAKHVIERDAYGVITMVK